MGKPQTAPVEVVTPTEEHDWLSEAQAIAAYHQPAGIGRPSAITDVFRVQKLLRLVAQGNYMEVACAGAGFPKSTLHNWKMAAKDGDIAAIAFVNALEKAESIAEIEANEDVRTAGKHPQFWAAAMTRLERRHPERWGRRSDSSDTPKVVVQIGAGVSDVKVGVLIQAGETLSPNLETSHLSPSLGADSHRLTADSSGANVNITSLIGSKSEAGKA